MKQYRKMIGVISKAQRIVATIILGFITALNFYEICQRVLLGRSLIWVQEISVILVVWLVFTGAAHVYCDGNLINVDFLFVKTRGKLRLIWNTVVNLIILFVLIVFMVFGTQYSIAQWPIRTNALSLPFSVYSIPLILASCSMILTMVYKVYEFILVYREGG